MVDVAALTQTGAAAGASATPQGAGAQAAAAAAQAAAAALSDSGHATSGIGDVKFGDINTSSGGGFSLSNKKLVYIGAFVLGGMLIYGLTIKK